MTTKASKADRAEAVERLRNYLRPGDTVTCVLRSVSRSGMSRRIDFYKFAADGGAVVKLYLSGLIGTALGWSCGRDGLRVQGCGMDMGFHVVHELGYALFGRCERPENERGNWPLRHEWLG